MKKSIYLLPSIMFCLVLPLCATDDSAELVDQNKEYKNSSIFYNLYDSTVNGARGAVFAGVATPCTIGLYAPYSIIRLLDLLCKKSMVCLSSAEQFAGKSREELEKETALRELTNRFAKAIVSTGMVLLAAVIWLQPC